MHGVHVVIIKAGLSVSARNYPKGVLEVPEIKIIMVILKSEHLLVVIK